MATIDVKDAASLTVAIEKPLVPGRAAASSSRPVATSNEDFAELQGINTATTSINTRAGSVTEVAPATDTASSGLNGRLQRIAQRLTSLIALLDAAEYETVAASQTAQVLGATGGVGDRISHLLIIPATASPGQVLLLDNAISITVFAGGASSVSNLIPFAVPLNLVSVSGAWKITTGADVSVIAAGNFT